MENPKNYTQEEILEIVKDYSFTPRRSQLVITLNTMQDELLGPPELAATQYVVAAGGFVEKELPPGTKVMIDLNQFYKPVPSSDNTDQTDYEFVCHPLVIDGYTFTLVEDKTIIGTLK